MEDAELSIYKRRDYKVGRFRDLCRFCNLKPNEVLRKYINDETIDRKLKEILDTDFLLIKLVYDN